MDLRLTTDHVSLMAALERLTAPFQEKPTASELLGLPKEPR